MKALVTGANKGIGFAIAEILGQKGYEVLVGARNEVRAAEAVEKLKTQNIKASFVKVDLNDIESFQALVEELPELDLLVNNAGIPGNIRTERSDKDMNKSAFAYTTEDLRETMEVNFFGNHALIKAILEADKISQEGEILNVTVPISGNPYWQPLAYITSKAALNVMTMAFGQEFKNQNSKREIFGVMPGMVATDLNGATAGGPVKSPAQAAEIITSFLFDGQNHNGQIINNDGTEISSYEPSLFVRH